MRKRMFIGALVAVLAVVLAGGLTASNMGFKLNYALIAAGQAVPEGGTSLNGTNDLSLPDNPQAGFITANDLRLDIGAPANGGITKLLRANNCAPDLHRKGCGPELQPGFGRRLLASGSRAPRRSTTSSSARTTRRSSTR